MPGHQFLDSTLKALPHPDADSQSIGATIGGLGWFAIDSSNGFTKFAIVSVRAYSAQDTSIQISIDRINRLTRLVSSLERLPAIYPPTL
jgi:hypothetical protein